MNVVPQVRFLSPLDLLLYFRSMGMSKSITNEDLAALAFGAREVFLREGTQLLAADQPVEKAFIVVEGKLEIDAGSYTEVVEAPTGLNWLRLHGQFETNRAVQALTDCLVLEIEASRMVDLIERNARMAEFSIRAYSSNLLRLRDGLPVHPDNAEPADPGVRPAHALTLVERLTALTAPGALWEHANLEAVIGLVWAMDEMPFKKGDVLWEAGETTSEFLRLVHGTIRSTNPEGRSAEVGAGFTLGVNAGLSGNPRGSTAIATTDGMALCSNADNLLAELETHPDMRLSLLAVIARALSEEYDADVLRRRKTGAPPTHALISDIRTEFVAPFLDPDP